MNRLIIAIPVIALLGVFAGSILAQDAKPASPVSTVTITDEAERLKVQMQLLLQENASLKKQLAQAQKSLSDANVQLADANEQQTNAAGPMLLKAIAEKHNLKPEEYEFRIDPQTGEMKFLKKPDPPKEAKK